MKNNLYRAGILSFCACIGVLNIASAEVLGFDNIGGNNGEVYDQHTEQGFDVDAVRGDWFKAYNFGAPVPAIFTGPFGSPFISTFEVSRTGGGLFRFLSVDLSSNVNPGTIYDFVGKRGGSTIFSSSGTINSINTFETFANGNMSMIDLLSVTVTPVAGVGSNNADNIVVDTVPEPASLLVLALGGIALVRRRR